MKDVIKVFKALSDPTRLRIMLILLQSDFCVCELEFVLKMGQSRISHQLRVLRDADLVEDIRQGRWILYHVPGAARSWLELLFKELIDKKTGDSDFVLRDTANVDLCRKKNIRERTKPAGAEKKPIR